MGDIAPKMAIRANLHELALRTPDVGAMADYYRLAMGYQFEGDPDNLLGIATGRRLRLLHGEDKSLAYACYAVERGDDLDGLRARLVSAGIPFESESRDGLIGAAVDFLDPDGNRFIFGLAAPSADIKAAGAASLPARLQHVVFATRNAHRLLDFYEHVLGFTLSDRVVDDAGGLRTAFLRSSSDHHSLALFLAPEDRLDHHCFEAGEWSLIRDWADHFAQEHIPLKWGPGRHGPGNNLFIFIHDPDGNWVELSAELQQVEADRAVGEWPHEERTLNSWGIGLLRS